MVPYDLRNRSEKKKIIEVMSSSSESDLDTISPPKRSPNTKRNFKTNNSQCKVTRMISTQDQLCVPAEKADQFSTRENYQIENPRSEKKGDGHGECLIQKEDNLGGQKRKKPPQGRKYRRRRKKTALSVRSSAAGRRSRKNLNLPTLKLTVLSWLIDSGIIQVNTRVCYTDETHTRVMLEGWITREGILCNCCSRVITVSEFEFHASSNICQPYLNTYTEMGSSLLQCQIDAWNKQDESARRGFQFVDRCEDAEDQNDEICGICREGGDLICCDSCPSTFHRSCLGILMLPPGDWHCQSCVCKFCQIVGVSTRLLTCCQCEEKYHQECVQDTGSVNAEPGTQSASFCGQDCKKLSEQLQRLIGIKNLIGGGLSWTLNHRIDQDSKTSHLGLLQRTECNSKLAVALAVMDECFRPIIDRRTGTNMIQSVVYNCGSNLNRLNYCGFYTAVLERRDEILAAASIRIHGTKIAEMPFIGTREIYRCQGMCRQLLNAIESALRYLSIEKLFLPSISERVEQWKNGFGFKTVDEFHMQEIRSMNIVTFPEGVLLQKLLLKPDEGNKSAAAMMVTEPQNSDHHDESTMAIPFDLNLEPSNEVAVTNTYRTCGKTHSWGVFYTLHPGGDIRLTRCHIDN